MNRVNKRVSDMVSPLHQSTDGDLVYRFYVYEGNEIAGEDFDYEDDAIDFAQDLVDRGTDREVVVERRVYATTEDASKDYPVNYEDIWSSEDYKVSDSRVSDMTKTVHLRGYAKMRRDERRAKNAELRNEDFEEKEKDEKQEEVNDSYRIKDADDTDTDDVIDGLLIITFKDGSEEDGLAAVQEHANEQGDGYETYEVKEQDGKVSVDMCAQTSDPNGFVKELLKAWGVLDAVADVDFKKSDLMEEAEQQEEVSDSKKITDSTYGTSFTLTNPVNDYNAASDYLQADDMTQYLNNDLDYLGLSHLEGKIKEIKWVLEDELNGYIVLYTTEPLAEEDLDKISEWIQGQCSDGLGEGFEQQPFAESYGRDEWGDDTYDMASFDWETNDYKLKLYDSARVKDSSVKDSADFVTMRREVAGAVYSLEKLGEPVTADSVADYLHINEYEADPAMLDRWYDIIEDEIENQGRRADSRIKVGCGEDAESVGKVNNTDILRDNKSGGVYVWVNGKKKKFSTKKDAEEYVKKTFNEDGTPKK